MPSFDSVALFIVLAVMAAVGVWALYTIVENAPIAKEDKPGDLPYKVDPPHTTTTVELAIPDSTDYHLTPTARDAIKWTFANAPELKPNPKKRTYVKRSKYWTDKRKKAAADKARKTKRKSK